MVEPLTYSQLCKMAAQVPPLAYDKFPEWRGRRWQRIPDSNIQLKKDGGVKTISVPCDCVSSKRESHEIKDTLSHKQKKAGVLAIHCPKNGFIYWVRVIGQK